VLAACLFAVAYPALSFDGKPHTIKPPRYTMSEIEAHIKANPNDAAAYCDRAQANLTAGECETAIQDYSKALALDPRMSAAYLGRSQANEMLGKHPSALVDIDKAIVCAKPSTIADALNHKIVILKELKRPQECLPIYSKLIDGKLPGVGKNDRAELLERRASLYMSLGKAQLAVDDVLSIGGNPSNHFWKYLTLGRAYLAMHKFDLALAAFNQGIATGEVRAAQRGMSDVRLIELYEERGRLYKKMGKSALADADFKKTSKSAFQNTYDDFYEEKSKGKH
jgi:tetratricopeptide (TPR) repeat protein